MVRRCRKGDRSAFEQLVRRYQKPVFNAAFRMLHDPQDAMDVSQTTFLKAFEHLGWVSHVRWPNPEQLIRKLAR